MSQPKRGCEKATVAPAVASDKERWVSRRYAARELGIDQRTLPKVIAAGRLRTKKIPGVLGLRYYLPDIQRVARESINGQTEAARTR